MFLDTLKTFWDVWIGQIGSEGRSGTAAASEPCVHSHESSNMQAADIFLLILAFFIPPAGAFIKLHGEGNGCGGEFWLNVLLTLLGWIPGVVHAFYIILR